MAVDEAKQYGDTVYVPAGTYLIDTAIRLPSCVSLVGDGYCSVIQLRDDRRENVIVADGYPVASNTWAPGDFRGETRDLRIARLRIRGNGTATGDWQYVWSGCGIMLLAATGCLIENCWIDNCFRGGILLSSGMGIDNPQKCGSSHNVIRNCRITACRGNGIDLSGSERNEATGCDFALIEGCHVEEIGISGIRVVNSRFVRVVNNTVVRAQEDGIRVDQCRHVLVMGNVALDGGSVPLYGPHLDSNGIKFSHSHQCAAIGNICHHNNQPNLELLNSQWCALAHNITTESGEWGILSRTAVGASKFIDVDILTPYQDASTRQYQVQAWVNNGHAIEGNLAVGNRSGGISLGGTGNSIVAGNVAALNNQSRSPWGVAGIAVGPGDGEGSQVSSAENVVADNRSYDDQESPTQDYGLRLHTGRNLVVGNNTIRNKVNGFDDSGNNDVWGSSNNR